VSRVTFADVCPSTRDSASTLTPEDPPRQVVVIPRTTDNNFGSGLLAPLNPLRRTIEL
jgi:hypothetical protein